MAFRQRQQQQQREYPESYGLGGEGKSCGFIGGDNTPLVYRGTFNIDAALDTLSMLRDQGHQEFSLRIIQLRDKKHLAVALVSEVMEKQEQQGNRGHHSSPPPRQQPRKASGPSFRDRFEKNEPVEEEEYSDEPEEQAEEQSPKSRRSAPPRAPQKSASKPPTRPQAKGKTSSRRK